MPITSPRASFTSYPSLPRTWNDDHEQLKLVTDVILSLLNGKDYATGTVTLAVASATTTTITDPKIGYNTKVLLYPYTANGAAVVATTYMTWPNVTEGQAVINHAANVVADRSFVYVLRG